MPARFEWIRSVFLTWAGFAGITAIRGFVQFVQKLQQARELHQNDYSYYVGERITGFMSHWNTFSAQEMFALTMLGAFLFFAPLLVNGFGSGSDARAPDGDGGSACRDARRLDRHGHRGALPDLVLEALDDLGRARVVVVAGISCLAAGREGPVHLAAAPQGRRLERIPARHLAHRA